MAAGGRTGRPGIPRRSTEQVRRALLDSATLMFARHGYGGASTKEIARGAGTSETAVYQHFGSKAELFSAAVLEPFAGFLASYTEAFRAEMRSGRSDLELTRACVGLMYDHFYQHRNSLLALISASGEPAAQPVVRRAVELMDDMYAQLHALTTERWEHGGGFPLGRSKIWLRLMAGMITSITALEPLYVPGGWDRPSRDELVEIATDLLLYGMVPEAPDGPIGARRPGRFPATPRSS